MDWQSQLINVYLTTCNFFSQLSPTSFAYCDKSTQMSQINSKLHTPIKLSRSKKTLSSDEKVYSKSVRSIRQSIEILFNWLIESSGTQIASKVRSTKGLIVHVFGRFSASLFNYLFKF